MPNLSLSPFACPLAFFDAPPSSERKLSSIKLEIGVLSSPWLGSITDLRLNKGNFRERDGLSRQSTPAWDRAAARSRVLVLQLDALEIYGMHNSAGKEQKGGIRIMLTMPNEANTKRHHPHHVLGDSSRDVLAILELIERANRRKQPLMVVRPFKGGAIIVARVNQKRNASQSRDCP